MIYEELRMLQLQHSHLLSAAKPIEVLQRLCGLQAQFFSNAMHALRIRALDSALPESALKSWTLRGTLHVFAAEDLPLFFHDGRKVLLRPKDTMQTDELLSAKCKAYYADLILDLLHEGAKSREELKAACFSAGLTEQEAESAFDPWGGLLRALCEEGKICHVAQEKKAFRLCPSFTPLDAHSAKQELLSRYFTHYGPATIHDAAYFFKMTQAEIKAVLPLLPLQQAEVDGRIYYWIGSAEACIEKLPDCLFLAGFDPLLLGHEKTQSLFLPQEHLRSIFSLAGIVNPAVLLHGRVVGKWKHTGKNLTITLFEPVSVSDRVVIEEAARMLWFEAKEVTYI